MSYEFKCVNENVIMNCLLWKNAPGMWPKTVVNKNV